MHLHIRIEATYRKDKREIETNLCNRLFKIIGLEAFLLMDLLTSSKHGDRSEYTSKREKETEEIEKS